MVLTNEVILSLVINSPVHRKVQGRGECRVSQGLERSHSVPAWYNYEGFLRASGSGRYSKPCPEHKINHQSCSDGGHGTVAPWLPLSGWWACDSFFLKLFQWARVLSGFSYFCVTWSSSMFAVHVDSAGNSMSSKPTLPSSTYLGSRKWKYSLLSTSSSKPIHCVRYF